MPKVALYNVSGAQVGEIDLNDAIFGQEVNTWVMHEVVKNYLANQRQGTQNTKTRSEVRGGGIKPWRQKGTGRARQGSIRAPQWTGGGVALGPKPRSYKYTLNKKVRRLALKSALSAKVDASALIVVDDFGFDQIKTKQVADMLSALNVTGRTLIITPEKQENVVLSSRNIPKVKTTIATALNTYDVLNCDRVVLSKDAVGKIEDVYA